MGVIPKPKNETNKSEPRGKYNLPIRLAQQSHITSAMHNIIVISFFPHCPLNGGTYSDEYLMRSEM